MNDRSGIASRAIQVFQAVHTFSVMFASALLFGCATPGSLMNVKDLSRGHYAIQMDFDSIPECNALAERLEPLFRKQADPKLAERTPFFAECTGMSIADQLIYQGSAEIPGIPKPVRLYADTRFLCEQAETFLGIKGLRTTGCRIHTSRQITAGPLLQIREVGIGTVLAELPMRTHGDCQDLMILSVTQRRPPQDGYTVWCVAEHLESKHLEQVMVVQRRPDRLKEGHIKMRILDQRRCRELAGVGLLTTIRLDVMAGCMPAAKPL